MSTSEIFPVVGQKSKSSLATSQAFPVADAGISQSLCPDTFSSVTKAQNQLPNTSTSRAHNAVTCESAMTAAAAAINHVCISFY